ncbi:tartrate dehydrogenase, partial [Acinetobacter guillouiae]
MAKRYKVATIAGDGIGLEVLPEGIKVVKAAAEKYGIDLQLDAFDWASCDYYLE